VLQITISLTKSILLEYTDHWVTKTMAARVVHYEDIMEYTAHNISAIGGYHDKHNIELKEGHLLTHSTFLGSGAHAAHGTPCVHH
jgi:hypothetical protein